MAKGLGIVNRRRWLLAALNWMFSFVHFFYSCLFVCLRLCTYHIILRHSVGREYEVLSLCSAFSLFNAQLRLRDQRDGFLNSAHTNISSTRCTMIRSFFCPFAFASIWIVTHTWGQDCIEMHASSCWFGCCSFFSLKVAHELLLLQISALRTRSFYASQFTFRISIPKSVVE